VTHDSPDEHPAPGQTTRIAIVGVGPRGLSIFERITANAHACLGKEVCVHLFEPWEFGSGAVWRTDQPPEFIMNIIASQITVFTDDTVQMAGPVHQGPRLSEWSSMVASGEIKGIPGEIVEEAARVNAGSYCRRSFFGHYLEWAYDEVKQGRPPNVSVREHRRTVVSVRDDENGAQIITTESGESFEVDEVVLSLGHGSVRPSAKERALGAFAAAAGCRYRGPCIPTNADLDFIDAGQPILMRGLGLCFFDYVALLTTGRGGCFQRTNSGLRYIRSSAEPHITCGSRRGVPLHGRADNEKGDRRHEPVFLTAAAVERLRRKAGNSVGLDFRRDCWPLIAKEIETVYYSALVSEKMCPSAAQEFHDLYMVKPWASQAEDQILRLFQVREDERWNWARIAHPWLGQDISSVHAWRRFIRLYLDTDIREARRGNVSSPVKSALDALRDIRNEIRYVVNNGGIEGESYRQDVMGWFNPLHAYLSLGPPWFRIEELVALIDVGLVTVAGPNFQVEPDLSSERFVGRSSVPGDVSAGRVLIDARLPKPDLARTTNPVLVDLGRRRQATRFMLRTRSMRTYATSGVAVTGRPFNIIRECGAVHPRRYVFGIPTEGANWVTETGIRPFVNSITAGDSDAIARSVLGLSQSDRIPKQSVSV
jgi:hypothetical protein